MNYNTAKIDPKKFNAIQNCLLFIQFISKTILYKIQVFDKINWKKNDNPNKIISVVILVQLHKYISYKIMPAFIVLKEK